MEPEDEMALTAELDFRLVLSVNTLALLVLGFFPGGLLELCSRVLL